MGESRGTLLNILSTRTSLGPISLFGRPFMSLRSAITHGISHLVGHVAVGTLADLVLWKPENFGSKPEMVLKSGVIVWSQVRLSRFIDNPIVTLIDFFCHPRWEMPTPLSQPSNHSIPNRCGAPRRAQPLSIPLASFRKSPSPRALSHLTDFPNGLRLCVTADRSRRKI